MSVYIKFYNIPGSTNEAELGPFASVVCDGDQVAAVFEDEREETLASFSEDAGMWHVHGAYPAYYGYFEVYRK